MRLSVLEICAGAGGQALGLEGAGFECAAAVEIDSHACATLRANRPSWRVIEADVRALDGREFAGVDLIAGGVPCPPFSIAGQQLGNRDERDLFPAALRLIEEANPKAILLENVPGLASDKFSNYRRNLVRRLARAGYETSWSILNASDFRVPQLRPRFILVGLKPFAFSRFSWPRPAPHPPTVGATLIDLMASRGWPGAEDWATKANSVAPTLVGGSKKHGGPDLGPTRARRQWESLSVDGKGVADEAPAVSFPVKGKPRLTVRMAARIQGFPDDWVFSGKKTAAYRQVGNAFPPPVAQAVGTAIRRALGSEIRRRVEGQLGLFG